MAAVNLTILVPQANFLLGQAGTDIAPAGTRGPFAVDNSVNPPSSLIFDTKWPKRKTVGRRIDIVGDAIWGFSHAAETLYANMFPIQAGQIFTLELTQELQTLFVAAAAGTVNLRAWCKN